MLQYKWLLTYRYLKNYFYFEGRVSDCTLRCLKIHLRVLRFFVFFICFTSVVSRSTTKSERLKVRLNAAHIAWQVSGGGDTRHSGWPVPHAPLDNGFRGYTLASVILIRRLKMSDTCLWEARFCAATDCASSERIRSLVALRHDPKVDLGSYSARDMRRRSIPRIKNHRTRRARVTYIFGIKILILMPNLWITVSYFEKSQT